ncbi:unnamed protein product, partial [marine sediment metagenome]
LSSSYEWFKGDFDKGIEKAKENLHFAQKHELLADSAYAANLLGSLYQQKNNLEQAQGYIEKAIHIFTEMKLINALASAMLNQATFCHWRGDFSKARNAYNKALNMGRQINNQIMQSVSLSNLGSINDDTGRFNEAITSHKDALAINPDDRLSKYWQSMIYYKKGVIHEAKSILEKAIIKDKFPLYYIGLALISLILGKKEHAEKMLLKGFDTKKEDKMNISEKIEFFLKTSQFHYENRNFKESIDYSKKVIGLTNSLSREYAMASAFIEIDKFRLKKISNLDIS